VLGRASYGKGLVQTLHPMQHGDFVLKLTTARWYTPAGRSIEPRFTPEQAPDIAAQAPADAARDELPQYRTAGGRVVFGGGGIHPDLVVMPDTFLTTERPFADAIVQHHLDAYFTAKLQFAVRHVRENPELQPGFVVTRRMLDDFFVTLNETGAGAERTAYDAASGWVELELADEISYLKWGETERRRRRNAHDAQVRAAVELLKGAHGTEQLLALAAARQSEQNRRAAAAAAPGGAR
jgi:carboxyl-terminal processing protease